jgi:hypothetical protein
LRVLEVGASAGLNLRFDQYRYEVGGAPAGDPESPVRFPASWFEGAWSLPPRVEVVERRGCDLSPLDPTRQDDRLRLLSFVWPDQRERFERLEGALEVARRVHAPVDEADAFEWALERTREPIDGTATVLFHSIFVQYLDGAERSRLQAIVEAAGERASGSAPFAWLRMEAGRGLQTEVRITQWPGGRERLLATAGYHGHPVRWLE